MAQLRGVGIGLGVAHGPVARMAAPLPAPDDNPSAIGADEERARVQEALAAVARELETIRGHVMQREEENNASYKKNEFPEWRLVPPARLPAVAASAPRAPSPAASARRRACLCVRWPARGRGGAHQRAFLRGRPHGVQRAL